MTKPPVQSAAHENLTVTAAGVLLITRGEASQPAKFLLLRHADRWDLPKGHAEPGEMPRQTAIRETHEETGIEPEAIELDPDFVFRISYPVRYRRSGDRVFQKTVEYFLGTIDQPCPIHCTEHIGFEWFAWPPTGPIQSETIDPLLAAAVAHLGS